MYGLSSSSAGRGVYGRANRTTGETYGVYGVSNSIVGRGVYGRATATSGVTYGIRGVSDSPEGYGGYFISDGVGTFTRGGGQDINDIMPDLMLGGTRARIFSEPAFSSSDIWLHSNDDVLVKLNNNDDIEDSNFSILDKNDNVIFDVADSGHRQGQWCGGAQQ